MQVLVFTASAHGPMAAATLPDDPAARPWFHALPGCPPAAQAALLAKGHRQTWAQWAAHLAGETSPYGGTWAEETVPDHWRHSPGLLAYALSQARRRSALGS